mmetsp:Transcript_22598/g.57464  ORF Transcript_22598/g.57464 Transcript_22598/m.57464 type:complete len:243 (+) Transcript_22598:104-832(+)
MRQGRGRHRTYHKTIIDTRDTHESQPQPLAHCEQSASTPAAATLVPPPLLLQPRPPPLQPPAPPGSCLPPFSGLIWRCWCCPPALRGAGCRGGTSCYPVLRARGWAEPRPQRVDVTPMQPPSRPLWRWLPPRAWSCPHVATPTSSPPRPAAQRPPSASAPQTGQPPACARARRASWRPRTRCAHAARCCRSCCWLGRSRTSLTWAPRTHKRSRTRCWMRPHSSWCAATWLSADHRTRSHMPR